MSPDLTVIVLDNDDAAGRAVAETVARRGDVGVEPVVHTSVSAGLAALGRGDGVGCIVTDDRLPACDGVGVCRRVRARAPDMGVVVYASGEAVDPAAALSAGAAWYLPRDAPGAQARLAAAVDRAVTRRSDDTGRREDGRRARDHARLDGSPRELHRTTRRMMRAESREDVASIVADAASDVLGFDHNGVRLYDADRDVLRPAGTAAEAADRLADRPAYDRGETPHWTAFEAGEPVVVEELSALSGRPAHYGEGSALYLPLADHGTLSVGTTEPGGFDETEVQLAQVLAANGSAALDLLGRETELRERTAELARQNERLETFASAVSHDLRGPLSAASGHLSLAMETASPTTRETLEPVERALTRMDTLTEELLTLAREGRTVDASEPIDVAGIARAAWQTAHDDDAGPASDVTLEVDPVATPSGDPERVRTVFENLFRNALEHGGDVERVRVGPLQDGGEYDGGRAESDGATTVSDGEPVAGDGDIGVDSDGDAGGLYVADDGSGFAFDEPERALERGATTATRGTGYGLAIVAEVVEAHGWSLTLTESAAGGARVEIRF
jgi:signal transduction histidine kinase